MPSVTFLRWVMSALSAVLLIFSFQFSLFLFHVGQPASTAAYLVHPISDIGRCRKFGSVSCTERIAKGNDFELILMAKMQTRHPVDGLFGSEFPAICNHCVVMAAWCRKTLNCFRNFCVFLEKRPLTLKFSKLCSESFHRDIDRRSCVHMSQNFSDGKSVKLCVYLMEENNFACLSNCRYCANRA